MSDLDLGAVGQLKFGVSWFETEPPSGRGPLPGASSVGVAPAGFLQWPLFAGANSKFVTATSMDAVYGVLGVQSYVMNYPKEQAKAGVTQVVNQHAEAHYIEARRMPGAGFTTCVESDIYNGGSETSLTPYPPNYNPAAPVDLTYTSNLWLASGCGEPIKKWVQKPQPPNAPPLNYNNIANWTLIDGLPNANSASTCINIFSNGSLCWAFNNGIEVPGSRLPQYDAIPKFLRGITIQEDAIDPSTNEAISLASEYKIAWYEKNPNRFNDGFIGAYIYGQSYSDGDAYSFSIVAKNRNGVPQEIAFNKYADNALCPQYVNISLGSASNSWNELWAKKYILPSNKDGGPIDAIGKPLYKGYTGEIRTGFGTGRNRLWICVDGKGPNDPTSVWGRINITV